MSLVEGVGDEVVYLVIVFLIVVVLYLAWLSTSVGSTSFTYVMAVDNNLLDNFASWWRGASPELNVSSDTDGPPILATANDTVEEVDDGIVLNDPQEPSSQSVEESSPPNNDGDLNDEILPHNEEIDNNVNQEAELNPDDLSSSTSSAAAEEARSNEAGNTGVNETLPGHMRVKLQYIDGRQRIVLVKPEETVGEFRRKNFSAELNGRLVVRFIIGGRELKNENMSLRSYNIRDDDVIHCLVSAARPSQSAPSASSSNARRRNAIDLGSLVFSAFGIVLALTWYARIFHRGYFNGTSTFSLVAITFIYGLSMLASYRGSSNENLGHLHHE